MGTCTENPARSASTRC